jgi:serine/threonine protein kinase
MGELVMGEKFAEGGQAELYEVHVKWQNRRNNEEDVRWGRQHVLKVFKKGTFLRDLQSQLPQRLLQHRAESIANWNSPTPKVFPRFYCSVYHGTLLEDGRFAFLMGKEHFDLHNLIERSMKSKSSKDCGPFSKDETEAMMYNVALGVGWLHGHGIVHRDLKASNVLVKESESGWPRWGCFVADYECSVGVVGTGFFRAPEILQACKERKISQKSEVFSTSADIYSYGMICYEILTGKLPFEDHPLANNCALLIDLVINHNLHPEVPEYVDDWAHELLNRCWQSNPAARPTIGEILNLLPANSATLREYENHLKEEYGENLRSNVELDIEIPNLGS